MTVRTQPQRRMSRLSDYRFGWRRCLPIQRASIRSTQGNWSQLQINEPHEINGLPFRSGEVWNPSTRTCSLRGLVAIDQTSSRASPPRRLSNNVETPSWYWWYPAWCCAGALSCW